MPNAYRLIEAAAGRAADAVLAAFPRVRSVRITIHKPHAPIAATFERRRGNACEEPPVAEALLALGGNVGNSRAILDRAIGLLCDGKEVRLMARSSDYRTPPWGFKYQPHFVNLAIG